VTQAARYCATLRHLRARQVAWRLRYRAGDTLGLRPRIPMPDSVPVWDDGALERLRAWTRLRARHLPAAGDQVAALRAGEFCFQRVAASGVSGMPPWDRADLPRLWRYHLHYFACATTLAAHGAPEDGERLRAWMHDWITRHPPGTDVAWDAFPTAARLLHWAVAEAVFGGEDARVSRSYAQQARWLARRLEHDVDGNHLLKNAVALAVAGTVQPDAALAQRGLALLAACCAEQILPDGGHYERSAMYHLHVLDDLLLLRATLAQPPPWLDETLVRMLDFLAAVLHPDGDIPLFNDAARDPDLPGAALLAAGLALLGRPPALRPAGALPASGFYRLGDPRGPGSMLVHAGPVGPDHQPGHAHGGLLGFELAAGPTRLLVDSGVHGYAGSPWRAYCRSTRAHNTVSVEGRDAIDAWGVFRVGRRAHGRVLDWDGARLIAAHDGFAPWRHVRTVCHEAPGIWLVWDEIVGPGSPAVESFLHAPPAGRFTPEDGHAWRLTVGGASLRIDLLGCDGAAVLCGAESPMQGWYCPEFGLAEAAPVLVLRAAGPAPLRLGYRLTLG
jgi:hypothetical protein